MKVYTTIDLEKQDEARDAIADHLGRHRPVVGDRDAQPAQRLHRGDGLVGRLRRVELQPRRPGPPPPGLDVQGDGADDGAAARASTPTRRTTRRARRRSSTTRSTGTSTSRPTAARARGNMSLRAGDAAAPTTPSTSSSRSTSARTRSSRPRATWASRRRSRATRPRRSAASRTASRRWRWRPPTRAIASGGCATAADGDQEDHVPRRPRRAGQDLPARFRVKQTRIFEDGVAAEATEILEQNIQGGTGTQRGDRLPGGRQDRHDRRQHGRLVRRLHAAPRDRRLGRLPEGRHPDERALLRRARRRRHVPGRDLGRLHEPRQGQLLRRLHAARAPVRLARRSSASTPSRAAGDGRTSESTDGAAGPTTPTDPDDRHRRHRRPRTPRAEQDNGDDGLRPRRSTSRRRSPRRRRSRRRPRTPTAARTAPPG